MKKAAGILLWVSMSASAAFFILLGIAPAARATDFSSTNFTVKDPVLSDGAGYSTSDSFKLWSNIGQVSIGSSDATTFGLRSGFLYFPEPAASPTPTPTPSPTPSTGLGSYLPPPPPLPPASPGLFPPILGPVGEIIAQIVGEPLGIVKCGRADYNCDGKVNLKDLSIFISFPRRVNTRNLSLVFSDWTDQLLRFAPERGEAIAEPALAPRLRPVLRPQVAQVSDIASESPPRTETGAGEKRVGLFQRIADVLKAIVRFFARVIGF
jgi:hypothetical protein